MLDHQSHLLVHQSRCLNNQQNHLPVLALAQDQMRQVQDLLYQNHCRYNQQSHLLEQVLETLQSHLPVLVPDIPQSHPLVQVHFPVQHLQTDQIEFDHILV